MNETEVEKILRARIKELERALESVCNQTMCEGAGRTLRRIRETVDRVMPPKPQGPAEAEQGEQHPTRDFPDGGPQ